MTIETNIHNLEYYEKLVGDKLNMYGGHEYLGAFTSVSELRTSMQWHIPLGIVGFSSHPCCLQSQIADVKVTSLNLYTQSGFTYTFSYLHHEPASEQILPFAKEFCDNNGLRVLTPFPDRS